MKVSTEIMIDGNVVEKLEDFLGYEVYIDESDGTENTLYYVKNGVVGGVQELEASMGQGTGYIGEIKFKMVSE